MTRQGGHHREGEPGEGTSAPPWDLTTGPFLAAEGQSARPVRARGRETRRGSAGRTELLRPDGLYGTKPATGGNKAAKLKAIRAALKTAGTGSGSPTDCDREGQLIGQGDSSSTAATGARRCGCCSRPRTRRPSARRSGAPGPNAEHARLYAAAVARRQADQIYNLSLTRTATVTLGRGAEGVIGIGRVKTPTLAIACRREIEIREFVPVGYFEVVATAHAEGGAFRMRHAPKERILEREAAQADLTAARGIRGARSGLFVSAWNIDPLGGVNIER